MEVETLVWDIGIIKCLILTSKVSTFKFKDQCLRLQLMFSVQDMTMTGYQREIKLNRRSAEDNLEIYNKKEQREHNLLLQLTTFHI